MRGYFHHSADVSQDMAYQPFSDTQQYRMRELMRKEQQKKEDRLLAKRLGWACVLYVIGILTGAIITAQYIFVICPLLILFIVLLVFYLVFRKRS